MSLKVYEWAARHRTVLLVCLDAGVWTVAVIIATVLRYEAVATGVPWRDAFIAAAIAALLHVVVAWGARLYSGRHRVADFDDALMTGLVALFAGATLQVISLAWPDGRLVPASVPFAAGCAAVIGTVGGRVVARHLREGMVLPRAGSRTVVVGAGEAGTQLVANMLTDPQSPYLPVAFVDDDPDKRHRRVAGVKVRGTRTELDDVLSQQRAGQVVIAIASADAALVREVTESARAQGVDVKVLPTLAELLDSTVGFRDLRDIELADLLGRRQIDTDVDSIAGYLTNRRVLVTGAGGSIGAELCRQIRRFGPAELIMLDRDESALHATQLSIDGRALMDTPDLVLADIRDAQWMERIFIERAPDVVFHAAALKHLPMLEQYPDEAWKTNVLGTRNVLRAAQRSGVGVFVNISTDKAAEPTSVLGFSKRIAERLTAAVARESPGRYVSVRFGNVLGSRGSMLTTFAEQIATGGPVTVTHPEATRYFMTIPEAVQLVIQAAAIGEDGQALVLEMGEQVRILDVAEQLIQMSGKHIDIVFSGLRPGEKLHEDLLSGDEVRARPAHPLIDQVDVPTLDPTNLDLPAEHRDIRSVMGALCVAESVVEAER